MNGTRPQRWPTVPIGRVQYHSGTRFDQSSVSFSSLIPSLSLFFLLLARFPISIPHHLSPSSFFNFFLFARLSSLLKTLWPALLVFYSESTSRQLCADDCPRIIASKLGECCCHCDFFFSIKYIES